MKEEILYISPHNLIEPFYINIAGISYCDGSYHIYRPKSAVFCMEYIFSGNGTLRYLGKEYHPKEGDVYMLEHGYDHEYFSDAREPWTKIWFNAAGPLVGELVRTYRLNGKAHFPDMNLRADFEKILDFCKGGGKPEMVQGSLNGTEAGIRSAIGDFL